MADNIVLRAQDVRKSYENNGERIDILKGVDLTVHAEDFVCVLGPSGCGKTTFLRCIAGFEAYTGLIEVNGQPVRKPGTDRIMVFQDFNQLFPWKTVGKNIQYPLRVSGERDKKKLEAISEEYLDKVGLSRYKDYYPHQLSGGMKQRVAIAKALALKPKLILMDEPFASLDAITRKSLQAELLKIKSQEEMTVIFITHNIQEAISLGNRIVMMSRSGLIIEDMANPLPKPTSPAHKGFSEIWDHFNEMLEKEQNLPA